MGVSSEQSGDNMNRFVVALAFVGCAFGAPSILPAVGHAYTAGSAVVGHGPAVATSGAYAAGPAVAHGAPVASAPAVVGQTHHTYAAGAPVVENRVEYGVVGHQVVQTGEVSVVGGDPSPSPSRDPSRCPLRCCHPPCSHQPGTRSC